MTGAGYLVGGFALVAFLAALHALGLRDHVSVLSGTEPANGFAGAAGLLYVAAWLVAVVAAPIFAIAAAIHALLTSFGRGAKK